MKVFKYTVDKTIVKSTDGYKFLVGKTILEAATGYVFAEDLDEAMRIMEEHYPSDKYIKYSIKVVQTNIIPM